MDVPAATFSPHGASGELKLRCAKAKARSFWVGPHDDELVAARAAFGDELVAATYRRPRPMAERSISWLAAKNNRRLRARGVERNEQWLKVRVAALNLRRLAALGLHLEDTWQLSSAQISSA